jgi:hypothetical protein
MKKPAEVLSEFLFWDVESDAIEFDSNKIWLIKRVLMYGSLEDLKFIFKYYGNQEIGNTAVIIKELDNKTVSFVSLITGKPKEDFVCYSTKQSIPKHWNF